MMTLYHGSNVLIDHIDLSMSKPNKDFGKGFYLTDILSLRTGTRTSTISDMILI